MIGGPCHRNKILDSINAYDKIFSMRKIYMIGTPEIDNCDKRMAIYPMIKILYFSFVE